ncbi:uncharacterized protein [Solanum lycopersicum]|uniref:uncharacterized protein n=1 Tax=Solanum lycopersicum TaxID=4081 RepID=UPI00374A1464
MASFEKMYGRSCRSRAWLFGVGDSFILGPEIIREALEKVRVITDKLANAYSHQKSYAGNRKWPLQFDVGDQVYFKISPMKVVMRFGRKGKLIPRYVWLYEILQCVGEVAYKFVFPAELASVHSVFHVHMLKKCLGYPSSILRIEVLGVDEDLSYEEVPVDILDRQVK